MIRLTFRRLILGDRVLVRWRLGGMAEGEVTAIAQHGYVRVRIDDPESPPEKWVSDARVSRILAERER